MLALFAALALTAAPISAPLRANPAAPLPTVPTLEAVYLYDLATPTGPLAITLPTLAYDRTSSEIFVVSEGFVRIFDKSGMESYRFGDDESLGTVMRVAVMDDGEILVLTTIDGQRKYLRCNFRGEVIEPFELTGLPQEFADIQPDQLVYRDSRLYFAERGTMRVVVTDVTGVYRQSFRLRDIVAAAIAGAAEQKPPGAMDGFNVDAKGNLYFTMSTMFAGGVVSPAGQLRLFGSRGSTPGRFNIIGGIDVDENGYIFVTDRLRSVVSVWDRELNFLAEFGHRGSDPSNLLTPWDIAVGNGLVFVAQAGNKGVKVYRVRASDPEPVAPAIPDEPVENPEPRRPRPRHPYPSAVS